MSTISTWKQIKATIRAGDFFGHVIGIEAAISVPVPILTAAGAGAGVLLLRTEIRGPGDTRLFKPEGALVFGLPGCDIASYSNYLLLDPEPEVPLDRAIEKFPHSAIASWTRAQFRERTEAYFARFPLFFDVLSKKEAARSAEVAKDLAALAADFTTLAGPKLQPYLLALSQEFHALVIQASGKGPPREASGPAAAETRPPDRKGGNMMDAISKLTGPDKGR